jgi:carboxymethylenebutenolidase
MRAYVARPTGDGPFPGVIVGAEIYGITGHVRGVCERLAGMGYVALAPDLHHRTAPWMELAEDAWARIRALFAAELVTTREQAKVERGI